MSKSETLRFRSVSRELVAKSVGLIAFGVLAEVLYKLDVRRPGTW
jgi:hypothetical protein